ncbi:MAG: ABC transporter permease [Magnetococcales bacterium]|nr:ABC transporter permease [Magnetococcales bacterium]
MIKGIPWPSKGFVQVWRRHFLVWRKSAATSLMGTLGEPFLYLMGMGYGLGRFVGEIDGISYLVYLTAGILAASSMNTATFEALYGGFTRMTRQNTFLAMLATPLQVSDVVAGEVAWGATKSLISGTAIFLVGNLLGSIPSETAFLVLPVVFLSGVVFTCMGLVVVAIAPNYDFFLYYFTLVTTPMFLFCGVFYPVESLPETGQMIANMLPLAHVVSLIRPLTIGAPLESPFFHISALIIYAGLTFFLAVHLLKKRLIV